MKALTDARISTFGTYKAVYDVECVDEKQMIYKGRPIIGPEMKKIPGAMKAQMQGYLYFSRLYNAENDWDIFYPEISFSDTSIIGVPFLLVPKEKLLFGYDPAPGAGIMLPPMGR